MKRFSIAWILGVSCCWGCSSETPVAEPPKEAGRTIETKPVGQSRDLPRPEIATRTLEVQTAEPGFAVFVNGYPARTRAGELLLSPCRVQIPRDAEEAIRITVAKEGFEDATQAVAGSQQAELNFSKPQPTAEFTKSLLASPLLKMEVHRPVALLSLNSPKPELDPYVEPGGLVIWFVGDRSEGRAIYRAERESPFEFFNPPQILRATQSGELPAAPSVSRQGKLVYVIPEKNRIQSVSVKQSEYDRPELLRFGSKPHQLWEAAQILPDGLQLYWTSRPEGSKDRRGFVSLRKSFDKDFKSAEEFNLPGLFPCLSADGLRQYAFDGKILKRARRQSIQDRFAAPEIVANLDLPTIPATPPAAGFGFPKMKNGCITQAMWAGAICLPCGCFSARVGVTRLWANRLPSARWLRTPSPSIPIHCPSSRRM